MVAAARGPGATATGGPTHVRHRPRPARDASLYLCTDARKRQGDLAGFLDAVLAGGVDIGQLRDKGMEAAEELEHLEVFADACARHGKLLAVNDRADVAHAAGADVLHLGQGDLPVPAARAILGDYVLIGRSTHAGSGRAAAAAVQEGVDYSDRTVLADPHQARPSCSRPRPGRHTASVNSY
ncbi:Thiamine-phosphate synthase OS=Streptomyces alboniger OX=132473 GN=thiE PE=3 SV=1 [Streptomyces alboniger]